MKTTINLISLICQALSIWFAWQHNVLGLAICLSIVAGMVIGTAFGGSK